jgi:hypothetical protein
VWKAAAHGAGSPGFPGGPGPPPPRPIGAGNKVDTESWSVEPPVPALTPSAPTRPKVPNGTGGGRPTSLGATRKRPVLGSWGGGGGGGGGGVGGTARAGARGEAGGIYGR